MTDNNKPKWVDRMLTLYGSGIAHAFVLHFNVSDHTAPDATIPPVDYLARLLAGRDVVAIYSRDRGIEFPVESMRQKALDLLGLQQTQPQQNAALAALQSVGAVPAADEKELPRSPAQALPLLDKLLRVNGIKTAVIIDGAELILPDGSLATMPPEDRTALATIRRWGRDGEIVTAGNPVFLLTGNISALHNELRAASSRFEAIEIPLPDTEIRQAFIEQYLAKRPIPQADEIVREIANATAGLSLLHVEDILLRAEADGGLTPAMIWERKQDIIRSEFGDVLEIIEPRFGFEDVGGLDHVKRFFERSVIRPIAEGRKARVPMGVLMTGPAGTGKSIMAEAVAKEAGINAVRLRIGGQIASKWQGEGERNLEKALRAVKGLAPTIVFIDEIDQAVQRGEGANNQQNQRIFQRLLEFMSDTGHRGEVVFLAATNRPDLMDAALRRPGRFDKKIPFLVPNQAERKAIFRVMSHRYLADCGEMGNGWLALSRPGLNYSYLAWDCGEMGNEAKILKETDGWTGAEIEAVTVKAAELVEDENLSPMDALTAATSRLSPSTADIQLMTYLAVAECNDRDLLPPKYQEMLNDRAELDQKIEQSRDGVERKRREL